MQFGLRPEKRTIYAVFIWKRLQEAYNAKGRKLCFVDIEKAFDRLQRKVLQNEMRKKGMP